MAQTLKNEFSANDKIEQGQIINSHHVSQSVDAFTGAEEYDITVKGTVAIQNTAGQQIFKFDGNNFNESDSTQFLVRGANGIVGYQTGGASGEQGPPGPPGPPGNNGLDGEDGENGLNGTNGTSGVNGEGGGGVIPINGTNGTSGTSGNAGRGATFCYNPQSGAGGPSLLNPGNFMFGTWDPGKGPSTIYLHKQSSNEDGAINFNIFNLLQLINGPQGSEKTLFTVVQNNDPSKSFHAQVLSRTDGQNYVTFTLNPLAGSTEAFDLDLGSTCSFYLSAIVGETTSGTSGTSPAPTPPATNPTIELDEPQITIQKNLNGLFQCQVPASSATLGQGDVGFGGSGNEDGSVNSGDVSFIYVRKVDKNGVDRSSILTERLQHFRSGILRLKDQSASTTDFSYTNVTDQGNYLHFTGISANTNDKTFNNDSNLETFEIRNATWVYELKPNQYTRLYLNDNNSYGNNKVCLVGLRNTVQGYLKTGEFLPGQRTTVEVRAGSNSIDLQCLTLTGPAVNNNSTDPYITSGPIRTSLGTIGSGKRAIVDFVYYHSNDGSRYGIIPTAILMDIV